jgi:hypothetical protein
VYCGLLLAAIASVLTSTAEIRRVLRALLWSSAATSLFGIWQWVHLLRTGMLFEPPGSTYHLDVVHSQSQGFPRTPSTFTEPSVFANYLIVIIPITVGIALSPQLRIVSRWTAWGIVFLELVALLLSFSVSGYVLLVITMLYFASVLNAGLRKRERRKVLRLAILGVLLGFIGLSTLQTLGIYPADVGEFVVQRLFGEADSAQQRFGLAKAGWEMGKDHLLTGVGVGNFPFLAMSYVGRFSIPLRQFILPTPSNLFILYFAELGIVGTTLFVALLHAVYVCLRDELARADTNDHILHAAFCACLGGALGSFLFLDNLFVNYVWILLGLTIALFRVCT